MSEDAHNHYGTFERAVRIELEHMLKNVPQVTEEGFAALKEIFALSADEGPR